MLRLIWLTGSPFVLLYINSKGNEQMATKKTANWSQGNTNKDVPLRIVHTFANTSIADWKEMVRAELDGSDVVFESIPALKFLHAWESGDTPYGFAYMVKYQQARQLNREMIEAHKVR